MEGQSVPPEPALMTLYPSTADAVGDQNIPSSDTPSGDSKVEDAFAHENSQCASGHNVTDGMEHEPKGDVSIDAASENPGNHENVATIWSHAVGYTFMNDSTSEMANYHTAGIAENGSASIDLAGSDAERQLGDVYSPEEERLWTIVGVNCLDFNAWTLLLEETEKVAENNILKIRKVYDAFLGEFPLCFGYWKKYADHELRLDSVENVVEVYERAVAAVTYSVDIWQHYCAFAISTYEDPDYIRRLFEKGLAYVGSDYLSYPLWDEYIRYEESHQAWNRLAMIYTRILDNPIQQLDRFFNCFKEFAAARSLPEICTADEAAMLASSLETDGEGVESNVHFDGVEQSSKLVSAGLQEAEELEKFIAIREEMYKKAKEFDSKIVDFETAIRRPYFHVRSLDDSELDNWHNYLDFIEKGDDFNKIVKLYERCVIACANYPEYWMRYVTCMESNKSMDLANNALARATQVFVKKQPEIHLFAARFRELSGDIQGARATYQLLYNDVAPCLLEAIVKHANMEYRLGNKEVASSIFDQFIVAEQAKEESQILSILLVQFSKFLNLVVGDTEKARDLLAGHMEHVKPSKTLIEAIIHLESILHVPKRFDYLDHLVERFITPTSDNANAVNMADREEISSIFLEFLDLFGDASLIKKAENRHAVLFMRQKSMLVSKKRHAEDYVASDKSKMVRNYGNESSAGQSIMGVYPSAQGQWPAQKASYWPPTSQAQGQHCNSGYAPQAGYNAYGGYTSYAHPQMAASVPSSTTSYGSYSPYPVQAYPQQSYTQPVPPAAGAVAAAAASGAIPQLAAATVAQPYYGGYY